MRVRTVHELRQQVEVVVILKRLVQLEEKRVVHVAEDPLLEAHVRFLLQTRDRVFGDGFQGVRGKRGRGRATVTVTISIAVSSIAVSGLSTVLQQRLQRR